MTRRYADVHPRTGKVRGFLDLTDERAIDLIEHGIAKLEPFGWSIEDLLVDTQLAADASLVF